MSKSTSKLDGVDESSVWAIVELMGHKVVAGKVSKSELFGPPMLRVDVPETISRSAFTQFYGADGPIYCITPVSETVARLTAEQLEVNPVSVYVPELITREAHEETVERLKRQHEQMIERYHRQMESLKHGLPAPTQDEDDGDPDF